MPATIPLRYRTNRRTTVHFPLSSSRRAFASRRYNASDALFTKELHRRLTDDDFVLKDLSPIPWGVRSRCLEHSPCGVPKHAGAMRRGRWDIAPRSSSKFGKSRCHRLRVCRPPAGVVHPEVRVETTAPKSRCGAESARRRPRGRRVHPLVQHSHRAMVRVSSNSDRRCEAKWHR
jgi:hypothetical protein